MKKVNLKKSFRRLLVWRDRDRLQKVADPFADWQKMVTVSFVLVIFILIAHYWLYLNFTNAKAADNPDQITIPLIKQKVLDEATQTIAARAARFQDLQTHPLQIVDPGL